MLNNKTSSIGALVVTVLLFISWVLHFPLLGILAVIVWIFQGCRGLLSTAASYAVSVLIPVIAIGLVCTWSYATDFPFIWLEFVALLAITWIVAFLQNGRAIRSSKTDLTALVVLIPGVVTFISLYASGHLLGNNLAWVLTGDAQNNTVAVREIISHNGANPEQNSAPALVQLFLSSIAAHSAENIDPEYWFLPIVRAEATTLVFLWCLVSFAFGLISYREFRLSPIFTRASFSLLGSVFPLTWYVLGFSLQAGFYNAPVALLGISLTWIIWREQEFFPNGNKKLFISLLLLCSLYMFMAWAPLALIPISMLAIVLFQAVFIDGSVKTLLAFPVLVSGILLACYLLIVVLPSFIGHGNALTADGWITEIDLKAVGTVWLLAIVLGALLFSNSGRLSNVSSGLFVFLFSTISATIIMAVPGILSGVFLGYYPRKLIWFSVFVLMFLVTITFLASSFIKELTNLRMKLIATIGALSLLGMGMLSVPFGQTGLLKVLPFAQLAYASEDSSGSVNAISESVGKKVIRLGYDDNDFLSNQWAFQWASKHDGKDNLWSYAYSQIKSAQDVCSAANSWGGGVTFLSNSDEIIQEVSERCGDLIDKFG